ncbi:MAG TPA: hypothetical protein PKZ75_12895 [Bacteroidia bacterium]|nr:hypothetical protein [Bacteroidia bacterium]
MKQIELPELGVLAWTIISAYIFAFLYLLLWMYRNWQRSERYSKRKNYKEEQYDFFLEITEYPVKKELFINLNEDVIDALFWIFSQGYVSEEDFKVVDINFYLPDGNSDWPERMRLMKDNYQECRNKYILHKKNNMVFSADNFFHTFFGLDK